MGYSNFLLAGLLMTGICLQLSLTVTAMATPSVTASKAEMDGAVNNAEDTKNVQDVGAGESKHPASVASGEKSITLGFKPSPSGLVKRDVEQEADSANGKTPFYLFKKNFYHPNTRRFLTSASNNEKDYSVFPPYTGGVRYQRHRRSFQTDSFLPLQLQPIATSHSRHPGDELEVQLDNPRDKEAFLRLMALLGSKESSQLSNYNNMFNDGYYLPETEDDEGTFQDEDVPIDLGYYGIAPGDLYPKMGKHPYLPTTYDLDGSESGTPGDLARMGIHLSEIPGAHHGLYISPLKQRQDIEDDWLEDPVPLQSHFKRSDNTFRGNPVKSHFRRYLRSGIGPSGYNYNDDNGALGSFTGGRFGSFYPPGESILIRKRRSFNPAKVAPYTM